MLLSGGNIHDSTPALDLMAGGRPGYFLADKAYDVDNIVSYAERVGAEVVIPPKRNRKNKRFWDRHIYKERHKVECFFNKLKQYRRVATRYEKLSQNYLSAVQLASIMIWLRF